MRDETTVIYNADCPVCSREIALYRRRAEAGGLPTGFVGLRAADLAALGLTEAEAARRLHVVHRGQIVSGFDAFLLIWRRTPGFGWLARLGSVPGVRPVLSWLYERAVAPALYALHRRRMRRR